MLDICLLGTGGMMPLPYRWLTSMMARCAGSNLLIDCGEGTQIALKEKGWSPKPIDVICFTHYHAAHISGLPGLLLTMGNAERTEPLTLIGPKGLERVVNALCMIAPELPFDLDEMIMKIKRIQKTGKEHFIVIVAEGVGNVSKIAEEIEAKTGIESRATILGHVQRGGSPTVRDRVIASQMGYHAVSLLKQGIGNRVVGMRGNDIVDYDINEGLAMVKPFDKQLYQIADEISI